MSDQTTDHLENAIEGHKRAIKRHKALSKRYQRAAWNCRRTTQEMMQHYVDLQMNELSTIEIFEAQLADTEAMLDARKADSHN